MEQTPKNPLTLETEDQGKKNPKTNKEASCGRNPNPEFSDWSERKEKSPIQKQF